VRTSTTHRSDGACTPRTVQKHDCMELRRTEDRDAFNVIRQAPAMVAGPRCGITARTVGVREVSRFREVCVSLIRRALRREWSGVASDVGALRQPLPNERSRVGSGKYPASLHRVTSAAGGLR
jgi:hypothetical protein